MDCTLYGVVGVSTVGVSDRVSAVSLNGSCCMAHFLRGYYYEPEYTAEEVEVRSKTAASVCVPGEPASDVANWCQCACCRPMPTWVECVCCCSSDLTIGNIKK